MFTMTRLITTPAVSLTEMSYSSYVTAEYWQPSYHPFAYDRRRQMKKLYDVAGALWHSTDLDADVIERDLDASLTYMAAAFDLYEGRTEPEFEGSFCFVVPTRLERGSPQYSDEIVRHLPLLRHVGPATRQRVLAGICPCVIDTYRPDGSGRRGAMVLAPLFKDMSTDLSDPLQAVEVGFDVIADTARFVRERLGGTVMGLGATLPLLTRLAANYLGKTLSVPGLAITTGHGGTVWLLNETIKLARAELPALAADNVGIIGTGGIGRSTADYLLTDDPVARVVLYDSDAARLRRVADDLGARHGNSRVATSRSVRDIFRRRGVIVSAVTSPISLGALESAGLDLHGTFVVDDSQPHAVSREAVEAKGGHVAWVIGEDRSDRGALTFEGGFDYGGWGPIRSCEIWGCEAEAGSIFLQRAPEAAVTKTVTPEAARRIGQLCSSSSIGAAPLQSFGRYIEAPRSNQRPVRLPVLRPAPSSLAAVARA
jgi:hypothetical protein